MSARRTSSALRLAGEGTAAPTGAGPAVVASTAPIAAWVVSLAGSYVVQDFVCSAARSAGRPEPSTSLTIMLLVLNGAMLLICVGAALLSVRIVVRARRSQLGSLTSFLAASGILSAALFGYGVLLIGATPLIYGACQ